MSDFPTRVDLFTVARNTILTVSNAVTADVVQRDGTDANVLVAAGSAMADACVGQLMQVAAGQFLDSAQGAQLDRLVFDRYGLVRKPASPSVGTAAFSTSAPAPSTFTIPAGTLLASTSGTQFVTVFDVVFLAGSSGPVYATVRSILAGADQQAAIGEISRVVAAIVGAPPSISVTNTTATAGADDREPDSSLRDRARRFWTTAQRGTLAAIQAGGLAALGVTRASAIEVVDGTGRPGRWVQLIVTDRYTDALSSLAATNPAYQAQSQALAATVFQSLSNIRCGGIFVDVIVAQVIMLQVGLSLTFSAGVDTAAVGDAARARIVNLINELSPGESFEPALAVQALRAVNGLIITGNEIALPGGVVQATAVQALRTTMALVQTVTSLAAFTTTSPSGLFQPGSAGEVLA